TPEQRGILEGFFLLVASTIRVSVRFFHLSLRGAADRFGVSWRKDTSGREIRNCIQKWEQRNGLRTE
ncbi:MAG: hypothetical protein RJA23_1698, partial [Bacteroidota bacterium]